MLRIYENDMKNIHVIEHITLEQRFKITFQYLFFVLITNKIVNRNTRHRASSKDKEKTLKRNKKMVPSTRLKHHEISNFFQLFVWHHANNEI